MLSFLFGVVVGAVGFWAYRFWKGDQDTSWEQPYSAGGTDAYYGSSESEAAGSSAGTGAPATQSGGTTPSPAP